MTITNTRLNQIEEIETADFRYMEVLINSASGVRFMKFVTASDEWHFPLDAGWKIYICNQFLESLDLCVRVSFENYEQYSEMVEYCGEELKARQAA